MSVRTGTTTINAVVGGTGPAVLLLHGFPQTHVMWHAVAPRLARRFTVVATDLRGYGDSGKPPADPGHLTYSNREMAQDQVAVMDELGFDRFFVAGHDRGGLVAHRLALDHPDRVRGMAVLDMVPTQAFFERTDAAIATACFHWFLHAQPSPLPERLIGSNPDLYLTTLLAMLSGGGIDCFDPRALAEYRRCFRNPATLVAICEDYRAAATRDIEHDMADNGQRIACPLLLVWGRRSRFRVSSTSHGCGRSVQPSCARAPLIAATSWLKRPPMRLPRCCHHSSTRNQENRPIN